MAVASRTATVLTRTMLTIASISLIAIMLVVVADVALRAIFNKPVQGAYDLVSIGLLTMVFFGIGAVIVRGAEILIDLIDVLVPRSFLLGLRLLAAAGTLILFTFLGWSMIGPAQDAWRWGGYSLELGIPVWVQWVIAFIGLAGILLSAALRIVLILRGDDGTAPALVEEGGL